jgi:adenine deaminase
MVDLDATARARLVATALGERPATLVLRGGMVVNTITRELVAADVIAAGDRIAAVAPGAATEVAVDAHTEVLDLSGRFVAPGLIDPHVHVESSNLTLTELARAIVPRGVLTLCADPHEIANVLGIPGIDLLFEEAAGLPLNLFLRVPGRVPAMPTHLETSGHAVGSAGIVELLGRPEAVALGGDINPTLLLRSDPEQLARIDACVALGRTVGGQLPGFTGAVLDATVAAGLEDTHVAESTAEVIEQLRRGLRVLLTPRPDRLPAEEWPELAAAIRQRGLDTRHLVLCSDDVHPNLLVAEGHLDRRVRLAVEAGFDPLTAVQMATINAATLMRLDRHLGAVAPGRLADLVILDDLRTFEVAAVVHHGALVAQRDRLTVEPPRFEHPAWARNTMRLKEPVTAEALALRVEDEGSGRATVHVVEFGGPKTMRTAVLPVVDGVVQPADDVLAIAVLERHHATGHVGRGFVGGLGIRGGAVACSVNHDSHNIFVVGDDHAAMAVAANAVAEAGGGYAAVVGRGSEATVRAMVGLPIAGLLSDRPLHEVGAGLAEVERVLVEELGCAVTDRPIYALNFLCLPNIPDVGVTDQGIVDTRTMAIVGPFA